MRFMGFEEINLLVRNETEDEICAMKLFVASGWLAGEKKRVTARFAGVRIAIDEVLGDLEACSFPASKKTWDRAE
jgi:hypothetical protein